MKHYPRPTGELQGDNKAIPNRGTGTGMTGKDPMLGGRSIERDATNRIGGLGGAGKSDAMDECCPPGDRNGH